jgi:hypothetical protein
LITSMIFNTKSFFTNSALTNVDPGYVAANIKQPIPNHPDPCHKPVHERMSWISLCAHALQATSKLTVWCSYDSHPHPPTAVPFPKSIRGVEHQHMINNQCESCFPTKLCHKLQPPNATSTLVTFFARRSADRFSFHVLHPGVPCFLSFTIAWIVRPRHFTCILLLKCGLRRAG